MPVSKKRKRPGQLKKREAFKPPPPTNPERWNIVLNGAHFNYLKDDPDFRSMIKLGRAINAIGFASQAIGDYLNDTSFRGRRQYHRGLFVLAGYLHEGIMITRSIKDRYIELEAFKPLRDIALGYQHKKPRYYARMIRNFTAFHLDELEQVNRTEKMLSVLKPGSYTLMGGDDTSFGTFHFEFADFLDFGYIVEEIAANSSFDDTIDNIVTMILNVSFEFYKAAHDFQIALGKRMELKEYVYK